jgi:hypothetical protein
MAITATLTVFIIVLAVSVMICIVATMLTYLDYMRQKRGFEAEIEHMREEVRACRKLLQDKASAGQHKTSGC